MFEEIPRNRVKLYFKYLVNAASNHEPAPKNHERIEYELRKPEIPDKRREELEIKIKSYYSKNRYLPYELRLKKLKEKYAKMRKSKQHNKKKLDNIKIKIRNCTNMLNKIKKLDISGH